MHPTTGQQAGLSRFHKYQLIHREDGREAALLFMCILFVFCAFLDDRHIFAEFTGYWIKFAFPMATIGIFDSGAGGLSVFREIFRILPGENYIYWSDNAFCPYGDKPREFIVDRARTITDFMLENGADIIVVACNTATAAAINVLRAEYPVKFIGMEPAVKPAAAITRTGVVGVLATAGTLAGQKYHLALSRLAPGVKVVEHVGRGFVELVESGVTSGPQAEAVVSASLQPLLDAGADVIVLGCTHYPFLSDVIKKIAGQGVTVIDPAPAVARHLAEVMQEEGLHSSGEGLPANVRLFSSGSPETLQKLFKSLTE